MTVPFVDLKNQAADLREEILAAVEKVVDGADYILGDGVADFEQAFANFCATEHAIGVANGTEAIHLTLKALGVGPGDEVITAANTFVATVLSITYTGATPVLVDVNPDDYTIDAAAIERAITARTKAIVPVHLYGQPADMPNIMEIARRHDLPVIQDACQAHGAMIGGEPVATLGAAACYSFYPSKNLGGAGDGGAVVTNDAHLAEQLRMLRNYGQRAKNDYAILGYNCRLDTIQAAILSVKLKYLGRWNQLRRAAAEKYRQALQGSELVLPCERPGTTHVYHLYVVQHSHRDALMTRLNEAGVQCGIHYPNPIHEVAAFRSLRTVPEGAPVSSQLARRILSLPMFPELTDEQIQHVADCVSLRTLVA